MRDDDLEPVQLISTLLHVRRERDGAEEAMRTAPTSSRGASRNQAGNTSLNSRAPPALGRVDIINPKRRISATIGDLAICEDRRRKTGAASEYPPLIVYISPHLLK
jgi:hypothetical protein